MREEFETGSASTARISWGSLPVFKENHTNIQIFIYTDELTHNFNETILMLPILENISFSLSPETK
jgi:hypothetical protein